LRIGLTVIALLLISALTAALIGPYYIDWNRQRAAVEAQLSRVLSERVAINGPIDLTLLPTPYIALNQVEVSDRKTGHILFSCDEMELALGLTSLARGQFRFTQASFEHPTIDLVRGSQGGVALPKLDVTKHSDAIAFDKVTVHNGRLRIAQADGAAELGVDGFDLDAEATSLWGPFKGSGHAPGPGGAKLAFSFATGNIEGDNLRFKAAIDAGNVLPRSEFDGALALSGATPTSGVEAVDYSGSAIFSGEIPGVDAPMPWRASGALKADLRGASLDGMEVRLGREDRALAANGSARMAFGPMIRASITLAAKQLNLDALLRDEGQDSVPPGKAYSALSAALAGFRTDRNPPVDLAFALETPAAILGGDSIADVALSLQVDPGAPIGVKLEASPPGRSHILASGSVDTGPAPDFKGRVDVRIGDAQRLRDWLTLDAPDLSARLAAVSEILPYQSASAIGDMDLSATGLVARNLSLALERSTFAGTMVLTRAVGAEPGRIFMDLQTNSLDIDTLPDVSASGGIFRGVDLSLALEAQAIRVVRIGEAQVEGGSLKLKLTKQGDNVRLDRLSIENLGGASVEANGASDAKGHWLSGKIDAVALHDFAQLVRRVAPGSISEMLVDRSGALSPAKLAFSAQSPAPLTNILDPPDSMTIQGAAGATHIDAKLTHDAGALNATLSLDAPDAAPLLRQMGLPVLSIAGQGRGHVEASFHGRLAEGLDGNMSASLAGSELTWRGRFSPDAVGVDSMQLNGAGAMKASNAMPLLSVLGITSLDAAVAVPTDLSAGIIWRDGRVILSQLQGTLGRARLTGDLSYRPAQPPATRPIPADPDIALAQSVAGDNSAPIAPQIEGALQVDRLPLSALIGLALGAPQSAKTGALWSDAKLAAGLADPPTADVALKIGALDVNDNLLAHDASVRLKLARGLVSFDDFSMKAAGGAIAGRATIRRDGSNASLSGQVSIGPIVFDRPNFAGQVSGSMEFASTGQSARTLVSGLAGGGQIQLNGMRIPHLDQGALGRIVDKAQSPDYAIDQVNVSHALDVEFNKHALRIADAAAPVSLTGGIVSLGPIETPDARDKATVRANFDLQSFILEIRVAFTELQTTKYWSGSAPVLDVVLKGPIEVSTREVDSSLFVAGLAAQAIARETDRIAALESDIRERAFFNRRLKAGQFLRRRELELEAYSADQARLKSEEDRRRVEEETLKAYEERRKAAGPEQPIVPAPSPNNPGQSQSSTTASPPILQPPLPMPRPPSAQQPDPTASGLY
jgi:hypothetical protein